MYRTTTAAIAVLLVLVSASIAFGQSPEQPPVNETSPITPPVAASTECGSATACDTCVKNGACVWCASEGAGTCIAGNFLGPATGNGFNGNCPSHWNYGQCALSGLAVFIMIGSAAGVIVLVVLGCLCRCLCCTGRRRSRVGDKDADLYVPLADNRASMDGESLHPKTDARRREMQDKYGPNFGGGRTSGSSVALDSRLSSSYGKN